MNQRPNFKGGRGDRPHCLGDRNRFKFIDTNSAFTSSKPLLINAFRISDLCHSMTNHQFILSIFNVKYHKSCTNHHLRLG